MNPSSTCPKCKAPLPANTVRGLCPKCLALVALESGSEDKTIVVAPPAGGTMQPALSSNVHYFGDYELLEEIARGGMGVVYKARQKSLNRIVAVKMILGGQLATDADVKRFRTEAEAAANLQHPNIVAIHEIGEHEGRHYFSMDFVDGKDLAHTIGDEPMSAHKAATLLKTIAEAVHFAHQRGTLHRDLKPHNVLIDPAGQPRITDFGLARRVEQASDLTREGSVMGSPSYMPPEQAMGKQAEIGPASDVYSLGAILYQMLTGHAPFAGTTAIDTLRQVIEQEPIAPSKLNDKVPSDLETICLKCLEKKPAQRYSNARELAEELERFLNHQPILAKPANTARKIISWCRQRPWLLAGASALMGMGLLGLSYALWQQTQFLKWRLAHPKADVPDLPEKFLPLMLIGCMLTIVTIMVMGHWTETKRRSGIVPPWLTWFINAMACAQILIFIFLALLNIRSLIWTEPDNLRAISVAWFMLITAFAMCWTGVLAIWRYCRIDDTLGLIVRDEDNTRFKVEVNWVGLLALGALFFWITQPLAHRLVDWGQFQPKPGFLPEVKGQMVMDASLRKTADRNFSQWFMQVSYWLALIVCCFVSFWKMPRKGSQWRDLAPPCGLINLAFVLLIAVYLPIELAAAAVFWGVLWGWLLMKAANLRRIETAKDYDPYAEWKRPINEPAVRRLLPWTMLGLIAVALIFAPGSVPNKISHAIISICISTGFILFAVFPIFAKSRTNWRTGVIAGISGIAILYALTDGFVHVRRFGMLATPYLCLLMLPSLAAGFLLYRAARKPLPVSSIETSQEQQRN